MEKRAFEKILINEWVLSDHGNLLFPVTMDINMMALLAGMERAIGHWEALLRSGRAEGIQGLGPSQDQRRRA